MKNLFKIILVTVFTLGAASVAQAAPPPVPVGAGAGSLVPAIAAVAGVGIWWMIRKK